MVAPAEAVRAARVAPPSAAREARRCRISRPRLPPPRTPSHPRPVKDTRTHGRHALGAGPPAPAAAPHTHATLLLSLRISVPPAFPPTHSCFPPLPLLPPPQGECDPSTPWLQGKGSARGRVGGRRRLRVGRRVARAIAARAARAEATPFFFPSLLTPADPHTATAPPAGRGRGRGRGAPPPPPARGTRGRPAGPRATAPAAAPKPAPRGAPAAARVYVDVDLSPLGGACAGLAAQEVAVPAASTAGDVLAAAAAAAGVGARALPTGALIALRTSDPRTGREGAARGMDTDELLAANGIVPRVGAIYMMRAVAPAPAARDPVPLVRAAPPPPPRARASATPASPARVAAAPLGAGPRRDLTAGEVAEGREYLATGSRKRVRWSAEETTALIQGCARHGVGFWKSVKDGAAPVLDARSQVDCKDRWRTLQKLDARSEGGPDIQGVPRGMVAVLRRALRGDVARR